MAACYTLVDVRGQAPVKGYERVMEPWVDNALYTGGHPRTSVGEGAQARDGIGRGKTNIPQEGRGRGKMNS